MRFFQVLYNPSVLRYWTRVYVGPQLQETLVTFENHPNPLALAQVFVSGDLRPRILRAIRLTTLRGDSSHAAVLACLSNTLLSAVVIHFEYSQPANAQHGFVDSEGVLQLPVAPDVIRTSFGGGGGIGGG
jgi:hypothetical protein